MKSQEKPYTSVFNKREWLYINDTTTQYDQGTSIIETTSLSNNSKFLDYNSAYLSVPLLITLTSNTATNTGISTDMPYMKSVSFKQSFLSMINSITVDLNGQSMVQQNQLIDIYNHFRLLTSESWTTQNRWSSIGFYPDVVEYAGYATANSAYGPANTSVNNSILNEGLTEKFKYVLDDTDTMLTGVATSTLSNLISQTELGQLYVSHLSTKVVGGATQSPVLQYSVKATIYLKDIHPLFEVIPISKSLNFKIQIFWNNAVVNATHDGTDWTNQTSQYRAYNGTLPLLLNNLTDGFDSAPAGTLRASVYVGDTCHDSIQKGFDVATGKVGKQVELHVQAVQMLPDIESNYAQNHLRDISYHDYYQFTHKNIEGGGTFNHLVSNGISNLKAVLIIPQLNSKNNNVNVFDDGLPQLMGHINNFNVLVGGVNVLMQDSRYTYQSFNNEFFHEFGVNGNQSPGLGSSLIDYKSWLQKPYYNVNCSKVPMEQQNAYRSLQIKGTNSSRLTMDYLIFAIYEKSFKLDVVSGNIEKVE
jgi:hypothetical protein